MSLKFGKPKILKNMENVKKIFYENRRRKTGENGDEKMFKFWR